MFKTATDIVLFIVGVFAIIGGLYKAYLISHKKWISSRNRKDGFFSGNWSNEAQIIANRPTHYIDLTLSCAGKKLNGTFNVRRSDDEHGWVKVVLVGKRHSYFAKCRVTYEKNGEVLNYGEVILKKNKERNLTWKLLNGTPEFFPKMVVLSRSLPVIG